MCRCKKIGVALSLFLTVLLNVTAYAQTVIQHNRPESVERGSTAQLKFTFNTADVEDFTDAYLHVKSNLDPAFRQINANPSGNGFEISLSIPNDGSSIEYYFTANRQNGSVFTYPQSNPEQNPIFVNITETQEKETNVTGSVNKIDFTILSPLPDEAIAAEDVLVAITLFYDEDQEVNPNGFKLYFKGTDVTSKAEITPYLITYAPEMVKPGDQKVRLTYQADSTSKEKVITRWAFPVKDPSKIEVQAFSSDNRFDARVELSARSQSYSDDQTDIFTGKTRVNGKQGMFRYSVNGFITSQEDSRLQPQNRYGVELYAGDFFEIQAGHIYPKLSPLSISGNRVFGVNSALRLFDQNLNAQVVYGQMRRSVSNQYGQIEYDEEIVNPGSQNADTLYNYSLNFANGGIGTFEREIIGGRFSIGNGRYFQLGLNGMKVADDESSLTTIRSYDDLMANGGEFMRSLTTAQRDTLMSQGTEAFQGPNGNPKPKENIVVGGDLAINIDNRKIQFRTDFGASALNENISTGVLNNERAEDLGFGDLEDIGDLLQDISWLIVVNENMNYLPFQFEEDGIEIEKNKFLFFEDVPVPVSLLASQSTLSLNYFGNNLTAKYRWVGPHYQSLASSSIRRDIAGFSLQDRFRMLNNSLYFTLGFESLDDNVAGTKKSTTNTAAYTGNVGWYPIERYLPRVNVGYRLQNRDNSIDRYNPNINMTNLSSAVRNLDDNGNIVDTPKDILTQQYTFSVTQAVDIASYNNNVNLSVFVLNTSDNTFEYGDFNNLSISTSVSTDYKSIPLRTNIGLNLNKSESISGLSTVDILGVSAGGEYFLFDDALNLSLEVAFTDNTVENQGLMVFNNNTPDEYLDDYYIPELDQDGNPVVNTREQQSYVVRGSAVYNFYERHSLRFDASFTNVNSSFAGVTIPNDHVVQLRYIFRF
jgi:hypothetical protein